MDFRRELVDDNGIVGAERREEDIVLTVAQFGPQKVQVTLSVQEAFEVAFSLLCLVQDPDDVDVLEDLMDTNMDNEEQRKMTKKLLINMVDSIEDDE